MPERLDHYWYSNNIVSLLLLPLSGLFCFISFLRAFFYKLGVFKSYKAPVPVVIVGNISVGGTGKTPLIIQLVKQLQAEGWQPAVISRGYGGRAESWPQLVDNASTPELVGDEPCLIYQHTGCPLVVGPDRHKDIERLLSNFNCDIILADDGMQHYALQRDREIVVVDAQRLFGNGFCLPSGPLREPISRLQGVDLVLFNGGGDDQAAFSMQAVACHSVIGDAVAKLSAFDGQTVHGVAGIGNPERFFEMLRRHGIKVIPHAYADHFAFQESDLLFNDGLAVLMTEKDAVKCQHFALDNHWSVPVEIHLNSVAQQGVNQLFSSLMVTRAKKLSDASLKN